MMYKYDLCASVAGWTTKSEANMIEVRNSSIEGLGVFALSSFAPGDRIREINVVREVTPESPLREDLGERADHCDYSEGKIILWGFPDRHINHSCDPNAYVSYEKARCYLIARRSIASGEEITCDYNINITGGTAWSCHCGAARCRGTSVGDFFKLPQEIRREYRPLLADWFVQRYRDLLEPHS
jgi:SET domain-containing protein